MLLHRLSTVNIKTMQIYRKQWSDVIVHILYEHSWIYFAHAKKQLVGFYWQAAVGGQTSDIFDL